MNEEAALALGATKWEMIRTAVLPYGKPGVIAAVDARPRPRARRDHRAGADPRHQRSTITFHLIETGGNTIAANIANSFGEANDIGRGALIASGLVLFAITLVVNMTARAIIYRRREVPGRAVTTRPPGAGRRADAGTALRGRRLPRGASAVAAGRGRRRAAACSATGSAGWARFLVSAVLLFVVLQTVVARRRGPPAGPQPDVPPR